jgi:long-chain fatty acid transport protein
MSYVFWKNILKLISKYRVCISFTLLYFIVMSSGHSAVYQIFPTLAYSNAAMLNEVKKYTAIIGSTDFVVRMKYVGLIDSEYGSAVSETNTFLPYLRLATRFMPKWVTSFDITHPLLANVNYPSSSFVAAAGTTGIIIDTNYSPKLSYQLTDNVAIGVGFDINNVSNAQLDFDDPSPIESHNKSSGWGYGWDVGLAIKMNEFNTFNLSYYSAIDFTPLHGVSTKGSIYRSDFSDNLVAPATFTFNLTHDVTPAWTLSETARYVRWGDEKSITLRNSANGNVVLPLFYNDIWSLMLSAKHQFSEDLAIGAIVEYDGSAQDIAYRPISLPVTSLIIGGLSLDYAISSQLSTKLQYAFVYANPKIVQEGPPSQVGRVNIGVNVIDLGFTWKM